MIYPWHQNIWPQLAADWANQPNARLFVGKEFTGKTALAEHFAQALLCESPQAEHQPCGTCPSCHLFAQGSHPDFYRLTPEQPEEGSGSRKLLQIKIDAVRAILEPLTQSSVRGGRRVVLITPAESLNIQAANALLKILEEPPAAVVFLLVAHNRDRVLPTIKSRCRQILLPAPDYGQALEYLLDEDTEKAESLLAFHGGAPLFVHEPEQDQMREELLQWLAQPRLIAALDYAAAFDKYKWPLALLIDWLQKWLVDVCLAAQNIAPLYYPDHSQTARQTAAKTNFATLMRYGSTLNQISPYGHHSLNVKMQAEYLLTEYLNTISKKAA